MDRWRSGALEALRDVPPGARITVRVSGQSMAPALLDGDEIVVVRSRRDGAEALLGDLVVLDLPGAGLVVHRLLWRGRSVVRTRGDATRRMDAPAPRESILGRVVAVSRDGRSAMEGASRRRWAWLRHFAGAALHRAGRVARGAVTGSGTTGAAPGGDQGQG